MAITFEAIATTTVSGSSTFNVNFNSIPQTYTDLRLVYQILPVQNATNGFCRLNNDSNTNYSVQSMFSNGALAAAYRLLNTNQIYLNYNLSLSTTVWTTGWLDIFSYTRSDALKTTLGQDFRMAAGQEALVHGYTLSAPITSVNLRVSSDAFAEGTTFTLYGIARAA